MSNVQLPLKPSSLVFLESYLRFFNSSQVPRCIALDFIFDLSAAWNSLIAVVSRTEAETTYVTTMNSTRFCDPSICETSSWVLGAAGECNNLTGICECPPGYSGVYILVSENDCHVSTLFKQILDTANFCVALSALVASIIALVKVTTEIFRIHRPSVVPIYGKIKMGYTGTDAKHKARHNHILQRKLLAVRNIVLFFIHSSCEVFRTSVLLRNHEAYAHGLPVDAAIISGIGLGASRCAFFLFLYIYTTSLPRNEQLSAVLGRRYDARKYKKSKCRLGLIFFDIL